MFLKVGVTGGSLQDGAKGMQGPLSITHLCIAVHVGCFVRHYKTEIRWGISAGPWHYSLSGFGPERSKQSMGSWRSSYMKAYFGT